VQVQVQVRRVRSISVHYSGRGCSPVSSVREHFCHRRTSPSLSSGASSPPVGRVGWATRSTMPGCCLCAF
jgi:hypothetical protein